MYSGLLCITSGIGTIKRDISTFMYRLLRTLSLGHTTILDMFTFKNTKVKKRCVFVLYLQTCDSVDLTAIDSLKNKLSGMISKPDFLLVSE